MMSASRHLLLRTLLVMSLACIIGNSTHAQSADTRVDIILHHRVDADSLVFDTKTYRNALGQSYTIERFRYYLSDVHVYTGHPTASVDSSVYLIDAEDSATQHLRLSYVPSGNYDGIEFVIGVDSARNCFGLQEGTLDPVNGMFWAWNTGYIFLKFDGHSPQSTAPAGALEYHIGGFRAPNNSIRRVRLPFVKATRIPDKGHLLIELNVNCAELFRNPTTIDFRKTPGITDINGATMMADNYADLFSITGLTVLEAHTDHNHK